MTAWPRRVCFLIRDLGLGGAERQLHMLTKATVDSGVERLVVSYYGGALEEPIRRTGTEVASLDKRHRWDVVSFGTRLVRCVRRFEPDVLYSFMPTSNVLASLISPVLPRTAIVLGVRGSDRDWRQYDTFTRTTARAERWLARRADLVIANSTAGARSYQAAGVRRDRIVHIPNGVDTSAFQRDAGARTRLRSAWRIGDGERVVGVVGRLEPIKGLDDFLVAAASLAADDDRVRFAIAGGERDPAYARRLRSTAAALGIEHRLVWAGLVDDMVAVYSAFDVLVSPSHSEGTSNVILEAMACGLPCVVTDVGDSASAVGDTGIVVPPRDADALAVGMGRGLSLSSDAHAAAVRARAEAQFGLARLGQSTLDALGGALPARRTAK